MAKMNVTISTFTFAWIKSYLRKDVNALQQNCLFKAFLLVLLLRLIAFLNNFLRLCINKECPPFAIQHNFRF